MSRFFHVCGCVWFGMLCAVFLLGVPALYPFLFGALILAGICLTGPGKAPLWIWATAAALFFGPLFLFLQQGIWQSPARQYEGRAVSLNALVTETQTYAGGGEAATLRILDKPKALSGRRIRLSSARALEVSPGDVIEYTGGLRCDEDRRAYLYSRDYLLESYAQGTPEIIGSDAGNWEVLFAKYRGAMRENLVRALPRGQGALLAAMLLGERSGISSDLRESWSRAGISHLLAVSGLHLAILSGLLETLLAAFHLPRRRRSVLSMMCILLFMGLAGFSASVTRAGIMALLCRAAGLLGRDSDSLNCLGFSAVLMLAVNPYAALNLGLQLSYLATMGVCLFTEPMSDFLSRRFTGKPLFFLEETAGWKAAFISSICVSLAATLPTIPLLCLQFGQMSLVSPLTNLFAGPLSAVAVGGGMLCALLGFFPFLDILWRLCATAAGFALQVLNALALFFGSLPFSAWEVRQPWQVLWITVCLFFALLLWRMKASRRLVLWGVQLAALSLAAGALSWKLFWGAPLWVGVLDDGAITVLCYGSQAAVIGLPETHSQKAGLEAFLQEQNTPEVCFAAAKTGDALENANTASFLEAYPVESLVFLEECEGFNACVFGWVDISYSAKDKNLLSLKAQDFQIAKTFDMRPAAAHILINGRGEIIPAPGLHIPLQSQYGEYTLGALPGNLEDL